MESAYQLLIHKIDSFIRKYYLNQIMRGLLFWTGLVVSIFLILALAEFRVFFSPGFKIPLVIFFVLTVAATGFFWIVKPLLAYLRLGKNISHEQAAAIIGDHFHDVRDKLLNILQLKSESAHYESRELIEASIDQKSSEIKLVPFTAAIDLSLNRKYLKYALPPLLILLAIILGSPSVIRDGAARLSQPAKHFERSAPFNFDVTYPDRIVQYGDAKITVKFSGQALPSEASLMRSGKAYKMTAEKKDVFSVEFRNIDETFNFTVEAGGFSSLPYKLNVLPKPTLLDAQVELSYPSYTGMRPEVVRSVGELSVPAGTKAKWTFNAKHTDKITVRDENGSTNELESHKGYFSSESRILGNSSRVFYLSGKDVPNADSVRYFLNVVQDIYPTVKAQKISDSTGSSFLYFVGEYSDDYGISDLNFHFRVIRSDEDRADSTGREKLQFERNSTLGRFSHYTNAELYGLYPGDRIEMFFEAHDNDAVAGPKASRSVVFVYKKPTVQEYKEKESENNENIKENLNDAISKVENFAKEVEALKEKALEKKSVSWEDKKKLEDLMKQHDELSKSLEQMQEDFNENLDNQEEFKKVDPDIAEKQEKIRELMEDVLSDEMKEMMDQLRQLMEEMELDQMFENLEDFEMSNDELEEQLDRMLELFKKLEFEQKLQEMVNDLQNLAEEQEKLSNESMEKDAGSDEILNKQEEINKKFEELKKDLGDLNEINKEQRSPQDMEKFDEQSEDISKEMQEGTEQLKQNSPKKASPKQKNAADQMKQMAQQMSNMMSSMEMMQAMEDMDNLRQLLENLVKLSFDQEDLFEAVKKTEIEQPRFRELVQQQYELRDDAAMIEDSLVALSKRVFQIESFVTEELHKMNRELDQSIENMEERLKGPAVANQQFVMTSANNLAIMLSEVLEQMQQAMAQSMPGNQQCQKPGGKGSTLPSLQQLQQQLNQDIQNMKEGMKKSRQPGGPEMSKEFARMAAEQAALREALRKMKENMSQGEKEGGNVDELMKKMDETETDLLNKRITEETLKRQEEIITNLLDMETAERDQDKEKKRESKTAAPVDRQLPPEVEEYLKQRQATVEFYRTVPPTLTPFYKKLVEKYFKSVN